MHSPHGDRALPRPGCPIRRSPDQHLLSGSPELIAASHVLRRLLAPRHPPCALSSLTMFATGHPHDEDVGSQRLGELPRACSRTDGYPSRLSKITSREHLASRPDRRSDPRCGSGGTAAGITRRGSSVLPVATEMGPGRVELPTSPLSGVRSSQLSYGPDSPRGHCRRPGSRSRTSPSKLNSSARSEWSAECRKDDTGKLRCRLT